MTLRDGQTFNMADYCIGQAARAMPSKAALLVYEVHHPDKPAEVWTFGELEDAVQRLAAALTAKWLEARGPDCNPPRQLEPFRIDVLCRDRRRFRGAAAIGSAHDD